MKTFKTLFIALFVVAMAPVAQAQTADEIITAYFENTGGMDAWGELNGVLIKGSVNAQGMDIPVDIYQMKDGKQLVKINLQGQDMVQMAFDGETMWTTNFMTMSPEKSDAEATENMKKQSGDFPNPFYNYADRGYTVELMGNETKEGTETYKIKLTQTPVMVDGKEEANVSYHYFDTENMVIISSESEIKSGPMKGQMSSNTMSDYQEVDGLYFPFDMGMAGQSLIVNEIVLNPEIDMSLFAFPETEKK
ncbi:outer membrane lipoprotein-sorting protein [Rasiella rasia]|uniref:Outer membrane lipoprotein-sorting protein n=1 Tax=Rasiella rasia TaxID=2744027 RepID=A0A6G6GIS0_9FLAO|nr:outer membrane lipoprotein-sorting protein [Rasiella rasia]QIE58449.1 outer membrane lipoprotein-sorting protein [Rasiella rasia]